MKHDNLSAGLVSGTISLEACMKVRDKSLPRRLSRKYLGQDPQPEPADVRRLIVRITPRKITGFSA